MSSSVYDFEVKPIGAPAHKLDIYKGKVLLIVNVASQCGVRWPLQLAQPLQHLFAVHSSV